MNDKKRIIYLTTLALIILYGIITRISVLSNTVVVDPIRSDAIEYFAYAGNLSEHSVFSHLESENGLAPVKTSKRPPGFPFFASFFYKGDTAESISSVIAAQTAIQCLVLIIFSGLCWYFWGALFSIFASLLVWTHPAFISINTFYLTESLFFSSLILVLSIFLLSLKCKRKKLFYFLLGLSIAISSLIRPTMEYYLLFILTIIFFQNRKYLKEFWPAFLSFFVIIAAWKIRNYYAIGSFSDPHLMINGLFHGSYPNFTFNHIPESYGFPYHFDPQESEYYNGIGTTLFLIWNRAKQNIFEYISWYSVGKQFFLWQWGILAGFGDIFIYPVSESPFFYQKDLLFWHGIHKILNAPVMIIGVLYSYFTVISNLVKKKSANPSIIVSSLVVYASLFHIIVAPYPRYGIPFKPFVMIMFLLFMTNTFNKFNALRIKS